MNTKYNIVLLGAYGFTALKIAYLLNRQKIEFSIAGRDRSKLEALQNKLSCVKEIFLVDIKSGPDLDKMLDKTRILISCIGPYNIYGSGIIEKAVKKGLIYMDITGEQHFIHANLLKHEEMALKNGACIINSLSFESALADLLAAAYIDPGADWEDISSAYYFERTVPSSGTRLTMQTSKFFPTYCVKNSRLEETETVSFSKKVEHPDRPELDCAVFMPYPEVLFFHRQYSPKSSASYLLSSELNAKYLLAGQGTGLTLETILEREKRKKNAGPSDEACEQQYFELILYARDVSGKETSCKLAGMNMYDITANIVLSFLIRILNSDKLPPGIHAPSETGFKPNEVLNEILEKNMIKLNTDYSFHLI